MPNATDKDPSKVAIVGAIQTAIQTRPKPLAKSTVVAFEQLTVLHWQQVAAIEQECQLTPWSLSALQACNNDHHTALAVLIDDHIAAYIVLMHAGDDWELLNITVVPELQRLGLGLYLLDLASCVAIALQKTAIFLEVRPSNHTARALYERVGFKHIAQRKAYYQTNNPNVREDAVVMKKTLAS